MEAAESPGPKDPRKALRPAGGRDELNLAEFPITLLSDRVPKGLKTLTFEDQVLDQQSGEVVTRKLTVTGSDAYGLPTAVDDEILVALIQVTKLANDFTNRDVAFTRYELLKLLGWGDDGVNYRRIEESLKRWMGVTLYYDKAWWNKEAQSWVSEQFHILDNVSIVEQSVRRKLKARGQEEMPLSSFTWNKIVFQSFQAENLKRLDVDTYFALESSVAKRMFRFLDKRFYHRNRWVFDLRELACEHVGLSRSYTDNGKLKEKLQPAIDELESVGFLEPMSRDERYTKVGRGEWKITLIRKGADEEPAAAEQAADDAPNELEQALITRGVTHATAADLVAANEPQHIRDRIETFDWLVAKQDKRVSKNPGGYLAESIRKGYAPPKGFVSSAEKAKRVQAEEDRRRKAEEVKRRAEQAERAREDAEQARIRGYIESLTAEELERLRSDALAKANPFFLQQYRRNQADPELSARYLKLIVDTHVSGLLAAAEKETIH